MIWVLDEFEDDRLYIIMGFVTLCILSGIIAYNIYLVSFYHACPLCGLSIGKCGDIGYRQVPAELSSCFVCFTYISS